MIDYKHKLNQTKTIFFKARNKHKINAYNEYKSRHNTISFFKVSRHNMKK